VSNPYQQALGQTLIDRSIRERIVLVGVILMVMTKKKPTRAWTN
jgi:hypothetical protein